MPGLTSAPPAPLRLAAWWSASAVERRLQVVVGLVAATAGAAAVGWGLAEPTLPAASTWTLVVLGVLWLLAEFPLVHLRFGANHVSLVWTEAVAVIGLALLPSPLLLLCGPLITLSHLAQRRPRIKAVFNGASGMVSLACAGIVLHLAGPDPVRVSEPRGLLALLLASLTYIVVNVLLTNTAVSVAQQSRLWATVGSGLALTTLVWSGNVALGLGALFLLVHAPTVLVGVPFLALVLALTYRAYLRAGQERDVWRQLEVASRELNRLEEREVTAAALRRARELFRCDDVELVLGGADGARTCRLVDDRLVVEPAVPRGVAGETRLVELDPDGRARPVTTCLSAPLDSPQGRIGALRLLFSGSVTLSARERQVLMTYAHAVSTTLQNARLHEDVRAEAARHAFEASHDSLTGLANRLLLQQEARAALESGAGTTALLLLDLDHFKEINDTLGHAAGDLLLQQVAARLRAGVQGEGLVARLGGDEFAVLLTGLRDPGQAEPLATRLLELLAEPAEFDGLRLSIEASLGVACHPQDADSPEELFRRADVAMYQAKSARGSWLRYDAGRDDSSLHRLALVSELRQALQRDEVVVHFQPQLDLRTGAVVSAEALCRWEHPTRGLLPPSEFVGAVEQSGLVRAFTLHVLERALQACARWNEGGGGVRVAVNLAARSLLDRSLPDDVAAVLARTGVRPSDLVLEITETTATSELEVVEDVLARLRRTGVEISVDDFGTGYSSLAFLQRTAVNELKVDQSFVRGMLVNDNDAALVRATVQLAHSLGARAVAEGVEDAAHAQALRELGCDLAQGWLYGRPVPVDEVCAALARRPLRRVPAPRRMRLA